MNNEIVSKIKTELRDILVDNFPQGVILKIKYSPREELSIEEMTKYSRKSTPRFRVKYDSDHYSCEGRYEAGVRVLADVICHVGPEKVQQFDIRTSGDLNLIQSEPALINGKSPFYLKDGYWCITKTASSEKQNQIRRIMEALGKKWEIEYKQ
ncbi:MAG: hypothetical protein IKH24_03870 [Bacteroidales bacterium]|nr:hypothetical protein [Bacteroidales bacterium]